MSMTPQVRLPLEPLAAQYPNYCATARALNVHIRQVNRWKLDGIPFYRADALAMSVGLHPFEVWGEEWWAAGERQAEIDAPRLARFDAKRRARAELVTQYAAVERARAAS